MNTCDVVSPVLVGTILVSMAVLGLESYRNILSMDIKTRHTIRGSYIFLCLGALVTIVSMLPALRVYLLGGTALVSFGMVGLILSNHRRLFEKATDGETPRDR